MKIHQIRNATIIVIYNDKRFLIDPWLMPKDFMPGFEGAMNSEVRQPRVDLPKDFDINHLPLDAVILTHFHPDHFDEFAVNALDKNIPFFVQNETDLNQHGRREVVKPMCEKIGMPYDAMGIVFKSDAEKTLYVAGDTIWCDEVRTAIDKFNPEVIVINACGATVLVGEGERLIMDIEDTKSISKYAKNSTIIASHMDTVSHLTVTRENIKSLKLNNVIVPDDDEILEFNN